MIIKLKEENRESLNGYLYKEATINTFIIGDVDNFGFDSDIQDLWGDFNENGEYNAVLLRYKVYFIVYATEKYDIEGFVKIINSFEVSEISGKEEVIEEIKKYFNVCKEKKQSFCRLTKDKFNGVSTDKYKVELANTNDAEGMLNLRDEITEFSKTTKESMLSLVTSKHGRTFIIKEENKIISMASTDAETEWSAMVINVCTDPEKRESGLAYACMANLCREVLDEGKELYLFYDNPKAGRVYEKLGFESIGKWTTISLLKN